MVTRKLDAILRGQFHASLTRQIHLKGDSGQEVTHCKLHTSNQPPLQILSFVIDNTLNLFCVILQKLWARCLWVSFSIYKMEAIM